VILAVLLMASIDTLAADTKLTVTLRSDPPGATVYEEGKALGVAPLDITYTAPGRFSECLPLKALKVRWISTVEVDLPDLKVCPDAGKKQQITVFRPKGLPGIELDAQYAAALLQQRTAAQLATDAAWASSLATLQQQLLQPRQCTSTVIGSQVFTNCFP